MRWLSLVCLLGCVRSELGPTQSLNCGDGVRVVVDYTAYCVLEPPGECPEALPSAYLIADRIVCAERDDESEGALLAAARQAAGFESDAGPADLGFFDQ